MVAARNVPGIDQAQPLLHGAFRVVRQRAARQHEALEVGPGREPVLARQAVLRIVQPGRGHAQALRGLGVALAAAPQQVLGLFLEMAQVGPCGKAFHENLRAFIADGPHIRQHKGRKKNQLGEEASASGFNPFRGPGCGLQPRGAS